MAHPQKGIDSYMRSLAVGTGTEVGNFSTRWTNKQPCMSSFGILLTVKTWCNAQHTLSLQCILSTIWMKLQNLWYHMKYTKTVVRASKNKRKREVNEDYKSIEEQHYEMLKDQVEFCREQVEKIQRLLNREVNRGWNHTLKRIKLFDKYGHSNVTL